MKVIHLDYDSEVKNAVISGMKILKQISSPYVIHYNDCFIDVYKFVKIIFFLVW